MKYLRRKLAGLLSAALLFSAAAPGTALAKNGAAADDDWVTVTIKSSPGGMLNVMNMDSAVYPYQQLPLDRPVRLRKGTELSVGEPTIIYPDGSFGGLAEARVNGKSTGWLKMLFGMTVSEDTTIEPEFIRIGSEWNEPYNTAEEYESLRFRTAKGLGAGYRLETPEEMSSLQLYERTTGKEAAGKFQITWCTQYTAAGSRIGDADRFQISEDGVLSFEGLEPETAYMLDYSRLIPDETKASGYRRIAGGKLYLSVGVDVVEPIYPIAEFEELPGMEAGDVKGSVVLVGDQSEKLEAILREAGDFVIGTEVKFWTDADGKVISERSLADLSSGEFAVDGSGYYPVRASYQPAKVEKIEEIAELTEFVRDYPAGGMDNPHYTYAETGEAASSVFLSEYSNATADDVWVYMEDGTAAKDRLIKAERNTKWYKMIYGLGLGSSRLYYYDLATDKDMDGSIYYYAGEDGALVTNEWVLARPADAGDGDGAWWYYFGSDGRAYTDGSYVADGKTYRFDEEGRCLLPGWFMQDGKRTFLDASGKPVKNTFAKAGDHWYYLDGHGFVPESGEQTVKLGRNAEWYEARGDQETWELQVSKPNKHYKNRSVYYLIDETGELQKSHWNEEDTMYFGSDGRAYQNCASLVGGDLYRFDKKGLAERAEPLENAKPSKIAAQIEKLKLEASERKVGTRDEAEEFVTDAVNALLPMGYEIATLSDAKRTDGRAFQAAADGKDGYWRYDVKITNNEAEDVATGSVAKRSARVATESVAGRFYATATDCELLLRANMTENEVPAEMEDMLSGVKERLAALSLTAENAKDQKAAEALIEAAVNAALPEGYTAKFVYSDYVAPGTAANAKTAQAGGDGSLTVTVNLSDAEDNEISFTRVLTIKASDGASEEKPEENPEEPDDKPDGERPNHGGGSGGGSYGYATGRRAVVVDTRGTWQQDANGWRFALASTGEYAKDAWHRINGKWYYFGGNTYAVKGWNLLGGKWYYMDETTCAMLSSTRTPDGYTVGADGAWDGNGRE